MDSHDPADQATTGSAERNQRSAICDSATSASAVTLVAVTMTLVLARKRTLANFWLETELTLLWTRREEVQQRLMSIRNQEICCQNSSLRHGNYMYTLCHETDKM